MTEEGFSKAQSDNLPCVDVLMVAEYIKNNECFAIGEARGVKADKSGRESNGDAAIGWVQVRREGNSCTIKGKITPEHNVRAKQYNLTMIVDENAHKVLEIQCHDCAASAGGCKHVMAFLMWMHRRSEEPSPTEVNCYWKRSTMSKIGTSIMFLTLSDFGAKEELPSEEASEEFLKEVIAQGVDTSSSSQLLKHLYVMIM